MTQQGDSGADEYRVKDLWIKVTPGGATEQEGQDAWWCGFCTTMDTCGGCTFCTAPSVTIICDEKTLPESAGALEELRVQLKGQLDALEQGEAEVAIEGAVASGVSAFKARLYKALGDIEEQKAAEAAGD